MWRAFFLALGINLIIIGAQCLVVEQVVLTSKRDAKPAIANVDNIYTPVSYQQSPVSSVSQKRTFRPKDWMPWSLLAAGAIIVIYTYSLPRRK